MMPARKNKAADKEKGGEEKCFACEGGPEARSLLDFNDGENTHILHAHKVTSTWVTNHYVRTAKELRASLAFLFGMVLLP